MNDFNSKERGWENQIKEESITLRIHGFRSQHLFVELEVDPLRLLYVSLRKFSWMKFP